MPFVKAATAFTLYVIFAAGCSFDVSGIGPDADPNDDLDGAAANDGAAADANTNCPWQAANFDPCSVVDPMPGGLNLSVTVGDYTYDTDLGELRDPSGNLVPQANQLLTAMNPTVRVMVVDAFTVPAGAELLITGTHPLLIASWTEIDILGTVDVGAEFGLPTTPANQNPAALCAPTAATVGENGGSGSGGGGGGGFAGAGGDGGRGDDGGNDGGSGGTMVAAPLTPRGGCSGAAGGENSQQNDFAIGGGSGGAVQFSAKDTILVRGGGVVDGRGSGGEHGISGDGGGGGGGSGGWLGFDAPTIEFSVSAVVAANGGGGGGGAAGGIGTDGQNGTLSATPALGGTPAGNATAGANGGAGSAVDGLTVMNQAGGGAGGGGGAAGYVIVWGSLSVIDAAVVSPEETQL